MSEVREYAALLDPDRFPHAADKAEQFFAYYENRGWLTDRGETLVDWRFTFNRFVSVILHAPPARDSDVADSTEVRSAAAR